MSQIMSHVAYLAKEIGPRPAGTEEEQQAALYITEQIQKQAGFRATIEDFSSSSNVEGGMAVLAGVAVAATILAVIFPILAIPAFIVTAAAAAIYALEAFDRPVLSRVMSRGASQNVVAKYQPAGPQEQAGRRAHSRKIVLVAHYDTGRVTPPLVSRLETSGIPVDLVCVGGMVAVAFFMLIRIFIASGGGMGLLVLNVLAILAALVCLVPIVKVLLIRSAPYNEGATNNATGTAALIEVARRIASGTVSEADLAASADDVVIHGEAAAYEAGLVPEGAQIRYEAEQLEPPSEIGAYSDEDRLLSAKAAIAALTGQPVERRVYGSVADNLVNSAAEDEPATNAEAMAEMMAPVDELGFEAAGVSVTGAPARDFSSVPGVSTVPGAPAAEKVGDAEGFQNAPSWFVAAQQNARKAERYNADEAPQVKRSRYTEAIENAERGFEEREEEARAAEVAKREEEARAAIAASIEGSANKDKDDPAASLDPAGSVDPAASADLTGSVDPVGASFRSPDAASGRIIPDAIPTLDQSPNGTVAMPTHVPAEQIRAEALAADKEAEAAALASLGPAPEPAPVRDVPDPLSPAHDRVTKLPSIDPADPYSPTPTTNPSRSGILRKLRTNIPSLSGLIAPVSAEPQKPQVAERPSTPDVTAPETPVGTSFRSSDAPEGRIISDADPVVNHVPEPVAIPRSRSGNLLSRLRKNDEEEDLIGTPQEWLNVDDDFEARSVGRERGSWESFRDDQYFDDDDFGEFGSGDETVGRRWEGGAYSRDRLDYTGEQMEAEAFGDPQPSGSFAPVTDPSFSGEIEQIYHFRNPQFNTEVWFVAMGSDGSSHDGARAFVEEHRDELRGSMIIEIESLGAGVLSVAKEEGRARKVVASSRVKRFTRSATAATGISVDSVSLAGTDSIASTLQKAGYQTMHLFGAEHGRPALKGSADDVLENVNEHALEEHVNFIFELLKG